MTARWPWPADTALDRARRVAASYRQALHSVDEAGCGQIDEKLVALGETWVAPTVEAVGQDDLLTAQEAAELAGVSRAVIYQWASRGHLPRYEDPGGRAARYRAGDVLDHLAKSRRARIQRSALRPNV